MWCLVGEHYDVVMHIRMILRKGIKENWLSSVADLMFLKILFYFV